MECELLGAAQVREICLLPDLGPLRTRERNAPLSRIPSAFATRMLVEEWNVRFFFSRHIHKCMNLKYIN